MGQQIEKTGDRTRCTIVDGRDASARDGADDEGGKSRAGDADIGGVAGRAHDLLPAIDTRDIGAHSGFLGGAGHDQTSISAACIRARARVRRPSSTLNAFSPRGWPPAKAAAPAAIARSSLMIL